MSQKIDLASVVVTYKTKGYIDKYLISLKTELSCLPINHKIVVVDNASNDGTTEMIQENHPEAILISNQENIGPARAFNQGIAKIISQTEYIIVANSDIKILPGTIQTMYDYLNKHPQIDGVNGPLLFEDLAIQPMRTHIWNPIKPNFKKIFKVEFIGTTFAMIRASTFKKLGGYDENYYFFNEDQDWSERAKRAKTMFLYLPNAKVIHYTSKGSSQNKSRIMRELYWSNLYYYKKFYPRWSWLALRILKVDIAYRTYKLNFQLKNTKDQQKHILIKDSLNDLQISKEKMLAAYHNNFPVKIPLWEESK